MNKLAVTLLFLITSVFTFAQVRDTTFVFKKRVLESAEIDFLSSYYNQDGKHAAVSGGLGSEKLSDLASSITVALPMNEELLEEEVMTMMMIAGQQFQLRLMEHHGRLHREPLQKTN